MKKPMLWAVFPMKIRLAAIIGLVSAVAFAIAFSTLKPQSTNPTSVAKKTTEPAAQKAPKTEFVLVVKEVEFSLPSPVAK